MNDPYYSPTKEEIADSMRAARRKFSNRFVPMNTYYDAMLRIDALEAQVRQLREAIGAMVNERYSELDMMSCEFVRGSSKAIAWESGVRQTWKLWDLSKQPGVAALAATEPE